MSTLKHTTLLAWVAAQRWMLHRPVAETMSSIVLRHARGEKLPAAEVDAIVAAGRTRRLSQRLAARGMSLDPSDDADQLMYRAGPGGSVAVVPVTGMLCAYANMVNGLSQREGRTPGDIEYAITAALRSGVKAVILDIDSPGGTVAGGHDLCATIERARAFADPMSGQGVPIVAYARNTCCSAAYLLASQCDAVYCGEQAVVGSIGVCTCLYDDSEACGDAGVRAILVASGEEKGGACFDGAAITPAHVASVQREIDALALWFMKRVASGRNMELKAVKALATGAVWVGQDAVDVGLVDKDGVVSFEQLVADLAA